MDNKKISSEDLLKRYRLVTFLYILAGIISVYMIKNYSWADWADGEMQSNNWEGPRISVWAWIVGIIFSIYAALKDIYGLNLDNKSYSGKLMMLVYTFIHLLGLFGTTFGDVSSDRVSWLKWYQIITVFSFFCIYFKIDSSKKKQSNP
jgi:hypothetical protein